MEDKAFSRSFGRVLVRISQRILALGETSGVSRKDGYFGWGFGGCDEDGIR